jgi:hypothetical protein
MKQPKARIPAANPKKGYVRRAVTADDLRLCAEAASLLKSLDAEVCPKQLPARFPRVMNEIATLWRQPAQLDAYFEQLLLDHRGGRGGFTMDVALELSTLKDYYQTEVYPREECVWQQVYRIPPK